MDLPKDFGRAHSRRRSSITFLKFVLCVLTMVSTVGCNLVNNVLKSMINSDVLSMSTSAVTVSQDQVFSGNTVTVTLATKDQNNNSLISPTALAVTFSLTGGTSQGTFGSTTDNGDGTYSATFMGTTVGTAAQVTAWINGVQVTGPTSTVQVVAGNYSLSNSTLTIGSANLASGSTTTVTLTVYDTNDNPITSGGLIVTLSLNGGSSTASFSSVTDHNNGTYTATVTGLVAGTASNVIAKIQGSALTSTVPSLTVVPGPASVITITAGNNQSGTVNTALTNSLAVTVKDANANLIPNLTMDWNVSSGSATLGASSNSTGSDGLGSTNTLTLGTTAGAVQITVTVDSTTVSATFNETAIASSTISSVGWDLAPVLTYTASNTTAMTGFRAKLLDAYGNTITSNSSATVTLSLSTGTGALGGTTTQTVSSGVANFSNITYTKAETIILKATENASGNNDSTTSGSIVISPAAADHLAKIAGDNQSVVAGSVVSTNPQVQVQDIYNNAVSGVVLTFTPSSGASVGSATVTTSSGNASTTLTTSNTSGTNTLTVARQTTALPGTPATVSFTETGIPGAATQLVFSTQPGGTDNVAGVVLASQPVVKIEDTHGNLITTGSDSTLSMTLSPSSGVISGTNVITASGGIATFAGLSIGSSGSITLTASATGSGGSLSQTSSAFTVHAQPQAPGLTLTSAAYSNSTTVTMTVVCNASLVLFQESSTAPASTASGWQSCNTSQSFTISSGDGTHTIYAWGQDAYGNVSTSYTSVSMVLDTTSPTVSETSLSGGVYAGGSTQNITWSASDTNIATSPIKLEYTTDGSTWTTLVSAMANSGTYSWSLPTSTNTTQAQVRVTATDKAGNSSQALSSAFSIDSTAPTISSITVNGGTTTTSNNYVPITLTASDNLKVNQFCLKYNTTTAPTSSDSCWVSVATAGQTAASSVTISNYSFRIGFSGGSYTIYAWIMDQAGNISTLGPTNGVDSGSVIYAPPSPPTLTQAVATSTASPNTPPSSSDLTATVGSTVYIFWQASSTNSIPSNGIALSYTTDDTNYTTISSASGLPNSQGTGCTLFGSYTGCYVWTNGSPTSSFFRVRAQVTDSSGLVANNNTLPVNASQINFLAGNVNTGTGSSANAAVFLSTVQSDIRDADINSLVIHPSGTIYFNDKTRGILKVDPSTGLQTVFIPIGSSQTGDGGPATSANLKTPTKLLLDYQNNLLIWDYDRIRLVNLSVSPATISTFLGGGASTSATVSGATNLKFQMVGTASNSGYRPIYALPNGDILVMADCSLCNSIRWYQKASNQVTTISIHGTGIISAGTSIDVSTCSYPGWAPVLDSSGNLQDLLVNYYTYPTTSGSCSYDSSFHGYQTVFDTTGAFVSNLGSSGTTNQYILGKNNKTYLLQRTGGALTPFSSTSLTFSSNLLGGLGYCADGTALGSCAMTLDDVFVDSNGNLYFAENGSIRTVSQGDLYTIAGQTLNYGNGGSPLLARFGTVPAIGLWNDGSQDRLVILDNQEHYLREAGLGTSGTIQQIAGTGVSSTPSTSLAALSQPIFDTYNNYSAGTFALDPSGNVYMNSAGSTIGVLNRSSGEWQRFSGGGSTPYYLAAAGAAGTQLQYNPPNYMVPVLGYGNNEVLISAINYVVSSTSYPYLLVGDTTTTDTTEIAGMTSSSAQASVWCSDGTSLTSCDVPYVTTGPSYFGSAYDSQSGAWFVASPVSSSTLKKIVPGSTMLTYLSGSFTGGMRNFAYNRVSSTVEDFWYCNVSTGKINKIVATNGVAGTTTTLSWPINPMACMGYNMVYSSTRNSLVFIYLENGMYGMAEYLNP